MLTFVLATKKSLVVSFWIFFKYLGNQGELEKKKTRNYQFLLIQGYLSEVTLDNSLFCFKLWNGSFSLKLSVLVTLVSNRMAVQRPTWFQIMHKGVATRCLRTTNLVGTIISKLHLAPTSRSTHTCAIKNLLELNSVNIEFSFEYSSR